MSQEPKKPEFKWVKPTTPTPQIYTNFINVSWTLFDVRFRLGQVVPASSNPTDFVVQEEGAVTLAWPEVKYLRDMVADLVERYEKVNGEIKQPVLAPSPEEPKE